jgi:hypothetical protein
LDTKQQALADIEIIAAANESGTVTRSQYREQGKFSTFEIDSLFGSFTEFKRQAGLMPTRLQIQLQGQVAKHVSFDEIRKLNIDRADYGDRYLKPSGKRFQSLVVASDLHDEDLDPFVRRVLIDTVKRLQPDIICLGGDVFDLPEFGKYTVDPRTWNVVGRIKAVHDFLEELREAAPDAQIDMIEGNHEYRLLRHLGEASPAIRAVLSDIHGMTVGSLLGLDKYEVRYIARGDLAAWTKSDCRREIRKNYEVYHDTFLVDHFPDGIKRGLAGCNGHHHKFEARSFYSALRGPSMWLQLGCGHRRGAEYCDGHHWNMGFLIAHIDTERNLVSQNYVPVGDHAEVGGKFYFRGESEF